jgi:NAD(P)-dependent dehydrogenase (short-subunit alcohol dehydrogenase family)
MPQNRTALITGANKGIGFATADALGRAGYRVYLGARDETRGRDAARQLTDNGLVLVDGRWVGLDVTDQASVEAAALTIADIEGSLDALVCNAGISIRGARAPTETPITDVVQTFDVNVFGAVRIVGAFIDLVQSAPAGRIVIVSTDLASLQHLSNDDHPMGAFPLLLAYNSSKTALNAVALHYAKQLAATSILVNVVSPGYVATDLNDHEGFLTPEQAAPVLVHAATLPADGPTGSFIAATRDGSYTTIPW